MVFHAELEEFKSWLNDAEQKFKAQPSASKLLDSCKVQLEEHNVCLYLYNMDFSLKKLPNFYFIFKFHRRIEIIFSSSYWKQNVIFK